VHIGQYFLLSTAGAKEAAHLISCRRNMTQPPADSASWLPVPGDLDYFHSLSNDGVLRFPGSIEKVWSR